MAETRKFELAVVGGGPAGYVAAIRGAQLGFSTVLIDDWKSAEGKPALGGTCLNVGCIPSKALLEASHLYHLASKGFPGTGIKLGKTSLDLAEMLHEKDKIVAKLNQGVAALLKTNNVEFIHGRATLEGPGQLEIEGGGQVGAEHIILAPGSVPVEIPPAKLDGEYIVDSSGALAFSKVPESLGVIGAGVIGLELGSVWARLGSRVVIFEALNDFLPMLDRDLARAVLKSMTGQGLEINLSTKVVASKVEKKKVTVECEKNGKKEKFDFDRLVVAVGRRPNTSGLAGENAGLKIDDRGFIEADEVCKTNLDGVYAIGDAVRGPMLAHKGSEEGVMVVENLKGHKLKLNYGAIPSVIYTFPEIAWVGLTEAEATAAGHKVKTGSFPLAASGRAMANRATDGSVKVVADASDDRLLGVQIFSQHAGELIAQATSSLEFMSSVEDLQLTVFAHPTLAESIHEAALAADGRAIHIPNRRPRR